MFNYLLYFFIVLHFSTFCLFCVYVAFFFNTWQCLQYIHLFYLKIVIYRQNNVLWRTSSGLCWTKFICWFFNKVNPSRSFPYYTPFPPLTPSTNLWKTVPEIRVNLSWRRFSSPRRRAACCSYNRLKTITFSSQCPWILHNTLETFR